MSRVYECVSVCGWVALNGGGMDFFCGALSHFEMGLRVWVCARLFAQTQHRGACLVLGIGSSDQRKEEVSVRMLCGMGFMFELLLENIYTFSSGAHFSHTLVVPQYTNTHARTHYRPSFFVPVPISRENR